MCIGARHDPHRERYQQQRHQRTTVEFTGHAGHQAAEGSERGHRQAEERQ